MKTKILATLAMLALLSTLSPQLSTVQAQATTFTYQGRLAVNGSNFTGVGQFKFALVTSTNASSQATATANPPSGGFITIINVTSGGSGYLTAPAVTVSGGGGSGVTATASVNGGTVTAITVNNPGSGYSSTPSVTVAAPPANITYTTYWSNDGTSSAGSQPVSGVAVGVTNGLFTVVLGNTALANMTALSPALFTQPDLQLRIWVNDGVNGFTALSPVQTLTPAPYATFATTAGNLNGALPAAQISGPLPNATLPANPNFSGTVTAVTGFSGNGAGVTNVNAATLNGLTAAALWKTTGNAGANPTNGAFLGTTDILPLEFRVNGERVLRLELIGGSSPNLIGGSSVNYVDAGVIGATIAGGGSTNYFGSRTTNSVAANFGTVGGGVANQIQAAANSSTIGGGVGNTIQTNAGLSTISGGINNLIQNDGFSSVIAGGYANQIQSSVSEGTISGGIRNIIKPFAPDTTIGGGSDNQIQTGASFATIGGGWVNQIQTNAFAATISGGNGNQIQSNATVSAIGGGEYNQAQTGANHSTIGGGSGNQIQTNSTYSTIAGGQNNLIQPSSEGSVIGGGEINSITASFATIGGGIGNQATRPGGTVPGGNYNLAGGQSSFAAGYTAQATNDNAFVWSDGSIATGSTNANSVTFRASGGYRFFTSAGTGGATLPANATAWTTLSDRNAKKNFQAVDTAAVLEKLAGIPVQQWNYKWEQDGDVPNLGPMAQDFKHAFYPGRDDKGISTLEFDGVELAAIQGLNRKVEDRSREWEARSRKLEAENVELKQRLATLESIVLRPK